MIPRPYNTDKDRKFTLQKNYVSCTHRDYSICFYSLVYSNLLLKYNNAKWYKNFEI